MQKVAASGSNEISFCISPKLEAASKNQKTFACCFRQHIKNILHWLAASGSIKISSYKTFLPGAVSVNHPK
jgi:hypothetical protein